MDCLIASHKPQNTILDWNRLKDQSKEEHNDGQTEYAHPSLQFCSPVSNNIISLQFCENNGGANNLYGAWDGIVEHIRAQHSGQV